MRYTIWFYLLWLAVGVYARPVDPPAQKPTRLRVMTYNIHHCNPPSAGAAIEIVAIAKVITKEKPDLVALQEVDVNTERSGKGVDQAKELARLTGMHYFFSKAIDHQGGDYGVAILSRFPVLESVRYTLPVDPAIGGEIRTIAAVTVDVARGKRLMFASTHLDLKDTNRMIQAELIVKHFGDVKIPLILAGDFNDLAGSPVIQYLDKTFSRSCQECAFTIPVKNPDRAIDFVMYRPAASFGGVSTRVIDEQYASDHLPVVVDLTMP